MPNIKSAKKRVKVNEKKNMQNKMIKSQMATDIKKFNALVSANEIDKAEEAFKEVVSGMDKAVAKNVIHTNKAARKQARLAKKLDTVKNKK